VVSFTILSEKALLYYDGDFAHKILSMGEASGAEEQSLQDYLLRELISEGRLRYPVVQGMVTVTVEKNGPVAFMVTTTKAALHPENETRMLSLEIDDSDAQTRIVLDKVAEIHGLNLEQAAVDFEPWRDYQRWLGAGNCKVVIPFADKLAKLIPPRSVRLRRDFSQLLLAVKAHALLHRHHRLVDERREIIANIEQDYATVAELMGGIVAEASGVSIQKEVRETIDAVAAVTKDMPSEEGATADKIAKLLRLDRSSAWRRLRVAMNKGFVVNLETRRGQPGRYRVTSQEIEAEELLPSIEALCEEAMQPVQPCKRTAKVQAQEETVGCMAGCEVAPKVTPHATVQPAPNRQEFERIRDLAAGCAVAPVVADGDPFACLKGESYGLKPAGSKDQKAGQSNRILGGLSRATGLPRPSRACFCESGVDQNQHQINREHEQ
jgi:predicted transcriptional regulator